MRNGEDRWLSEAKLLVSLKRCSRYVRIALWLDATLRPHKLQSTILYLLLHRLVSFICMLIVSLHTIDNISIVCDAAVCCSVCLCYILPHVSIWHIVRVVRTVGVETMKDVATCVQCSNIDLNWSSAAHRIQCTLLLFALHFVMYTPWWCDTATHGYETSAIHTVRRWKWKVAHSLFTTFQSLPFHFHLYRLNSFRSLFSLHPLQSIALWWWHARGIANTP